MKAINRSEIAAALVIGIIGLAIVWIGSGYSFGSVRRMGPGFFPIVVGSVLMLICAGLVVEAIRSKPFPIEMQARPFIMIMVSIAAFAVLMERIGLVPAIVCLVVLSAMAERPFRPLRTLFVAAAISLMGVGIFIYGLGLPLAPWRW